MFAELHLLRPEAPSTKTQWDLVLPALRRSGDWGLDLGISMPLLRKWHGRLELCSVSGNFARQSVAKNFMPTYDYSCEKCGKTFEAFQSMRDEPFRECPKQLCQLPKWGHGKVKRLLGTGAGVIFKGSGFYSTDYRSAAYKEAAKKESGGGEKSGESKESSGKPKESPKTADGGKSKTQSAG